MNQPLSSRPAIAGSRRDTLRRAARAPERGRAVSASAAGFTLAEILIAIALVVIIGGLAAANMVGIANGVNHQPPAKVLQATIRQARYLALDRMKPVMLTYNGDNHSFDILDDQGNVLEQDPDGVEDPSVTLKLSFTPIEPVKNLGDDPNPESDDGITFSNTSTPRLLFHPSGATAPVKVTLTLDDQDKSFRLDPFSEGPPSRPPTDVPNLP